MCHGWARALPQPPIHERKISVSPKKPAVEGSLVDLALEIARFKPVPYGCSLGCSLHFPATDIRKFTETSRNALKNPEMQTHTHLAPRVSRRNAEVSPNPATIWKDATLANFLLKNFLLRDSWKFKTCKVWKKSLTLNFLTPRTSNKCKSFLEEIFIFKIAPDCWSAESLVESSAVDY